MHKQAKFRTAWRYYTVRKCTGNPAARKHGY